MPDSIDIKIDATRRSYLAVRRGSREPGKPLATETGEIVTLGAALEELGVLAEELSEHNDELEAVAATLEAERRRYKDLFESSPVAYVVLDTVGIVREANRLTTSLMGARSGGIVGKPFVLFLTKADRRDFSTRLSRLAKEGGFQRWATRLERRGRPEVPVELHIGPARDADGKISGFRCLMTDGSERGLADELQQVALEREHDAGEQLRAINAMKDLLLSAVSHDIRGPLTAVMGIARTMQIHPELPDATRGELVERLVAASEKIARLVADLLDLDRIERGALEPRLEATDVRALVSRVVGEADGAAPGALTLDVEPIVAMLDGPRVERIVDNLVANSIWHGKSSVAVNVAVHRVDDGILIAVEDDGEGVPDDLKEEIFRPFARGPDARQGGSGIGLALVARFAELHGGRAWVEDRPGGGASFRVHLPVKTLERPETRDEG